MTSTPENSEEADIDLPGSGMGGMAARAGIQAVGGAVPFFGGLLSAIASAWSEREQERINKFLKEWLEMLRDEMREKHQTIQEIIARLDLNDEKVKERIESTEYKQLLRKTFREWSAAESEDKRILIRNILSNAAGASIVSDDVVRLFIAWIGTYSVLHFQVMEAIYNSAGITRRGIWTKLGKDLVREDSADADLFKLLIRDLSTGGIIRQHRVTDYHGNFVRKQPERKLKGTTTDRTLASAFDDEDGYELTALGQQFVHYAMNDIAPRLTYASSDNAQTGK